MGSRSYGHYCAVAKALDVVGERWSLLVVRELLSGPKRYTDLLAGLPGIATDMLAARLRSLEESGVIARRPPPGGPRAYELTPRGHELRPLLAELARLGTGLLGEQGADEAFHLHWIAPSLLAMFRPEQAAGVSLTIEFRAGAEALHARVADGTLRTVAGPADDPDAVLIFADAATLAEVARDAHTAAAAVSAGRLTVSGRPDAVDAAKRLFGLDRDDGAGAAVRTPAGG